MERRQIYARAKAINVSAMVIVCLCALAPAALALSEQTERPALKSSVGRIRQRPDVFPGKGAGRKGCIPQTKKTFTGSTRSATIKNASCMRNSSRNARRFAQVEIVLSERCSLKRVSSFSQAPGSELIVLEGPKRVIIELPAKDVKALRKEGVQITILKKFFLAEGSTKKSTVKSLVSLTTCPDSYREGSNDTNYVIPDNGYPDDWAYSEITITGAPGDHIVHCVDVHYEIDHTYISDLYVDLSDDNEEHSYILWYFEGGDGVNINETETEITEFYGEPVNQTWVLWAIDAWEDDEGYIDSWWIKVYHGPASSPPSNDDCAAAISVTEDVPYDGTTVSATGSTESSCSYNDTLDVWNSFTPTSSGLYTISTAGSSFDTTLSVFDGCSGDELSCNDDGSCEGTFQSEVTMNMSAGNTYLIRIAGFDASQGDYTLLVTAYVCSVPTAADNPYPPNDDTDVETDTLLSWNEGGGSKGRKIPAKTTQTKGLNEAKLIYGSDDRLEEYQITDPCLLSVGDSTVALVPQADLTNNGDGTYTFRSTYPFTLAEWYQWIDPIGTGNPLCSDEPFRDQPAPASGSGFLVAEDIIITAGHLACDYDCSGGDALAIIFGFVMLDADTAVLTVDESEIYYCNEVLGRTDGHPDWAIIRLDRPVTGHEPLPFRTSGEIPNNEPVIVIGHPYGVPRKYAGGATVRDNSGVTYFSANTDTYQGNSGSVVINANSLEVEGILFGGNVDWVEDGSCDRSNVCPDSGCPGWEDITRITTISDFFPWERYDVYFGTDNPPTQLIFSGLTTPTCDPCEPGNLLSNETYYWQVVTKSICGESPSNPIWHFTTLEPNCIVPEVVGMPESEAEAAITAAGLTVGSKVYTYDDVVPAGYVINQAPGAGMSVSCGSPVGLTISEGPTPDTEPPVPNPATWTSVPTATGENSISMTATTATDPSGVEYFFDETSSNPGGSDSGWRTSPSYTDTGLTKATQYTYRVQLRDQSPNHNTGSWSASESARTEGADLDLNDDGRINSADLLILAYYWMDEACSEPDWCEGADCDYSGIVDYLDFAVLAYDWLTLTGEPNLVDHWTMDDDAENTTVSDNSSNGNDGSAQQYTSVLHATGVIDGALIFNGASDYIDLGSPAVLTDLPADDFTVSAWIYDESTTSKGTIIGVFPDGTAGWILRKQGTGAARYLDFWAGHSTTNAYFATPAGSLASDSWRHVAAVWDAGTKTCRIYIDGFESSYVTSTAGQGSYNSDVSYDKEIGRMALAGGIQFFAGKIDDVKIFNKALTSGEIQELYGLIGYWRMDDDAEDTTVSDSSSNGNDGIAQQNTSILHTTGRIDGALTFDGASDYINLGSPVTFDDLPADDFTVSAWIYDESTTSKATIMGAFPDGTAGWLLRKQGTGAARYLNFWAGHSTTNAYFATPAGSLASDSWRHVAAVWDAGTKTCRIYIDGFESSYVTSTAGQGSYNSDVSYDKEIGRMAYMGGIQFFDGILDDLKVFDKALSQEEIAALYGQ